MSLPPGRASLARRLSDFVDESLQGVATETFEGLALDVAAWQRTHAPVLTALTTGVPAHWTDIPAVPVALFKDLAVGTVPRGEGSAVYRTSGTTTDARGVHRLWKADLYDHGATAWARRCLGRAPTDVAALLHDPRKAPDSSLSHMVATFDRLFEPHGSITWHLEQGRVLTDSLQARVEAATGPLFVATTAFALADWLEQGPPALPAGSVLMVTGGFKGRRTEVSERSLLDRAVAALASPRIVMEYGMTELSSQLWADAGEPYAPPPWLRAVAVDPATGQPLPSGTPGQLRFYDLLNLDSTLGVETLDEGVVQPDGRVRLHGRLTGAEARGCSLTVEDAWVHDTPR